MRDYRSIFIPVLIISILLLFAGCGKKEPAKISGVPKYRLADRTEGIELMMSNDQYYDGFTQNDLDFRMQKTGATMGEYKSHIGCGCGLCKTGKKEKTQ